MYCPKCGKENSDNTSFCIYCGTRLVNVENSAETTVLKQNYYANNPQQYNSLNNGQPNNFYTQQQNYMPAKKKKLSKGAIIAIVIVAIFIVGALGFAAVKIYQYQKAVEAVENIEMPEIPDFDIDSDFETYGDFSENETVTYGTVNENEYINSYADLNIITPSDEWDLLSKAEIYEFYSELGTAVTFDETTQETYYANLGGNVYYDMIMVNTVNNSNVQVMLLDKSSDENITLDDCFNALKSELYSNYDNATFEPASIMTIGNNIYSVKKGTASVNGAGMVQYYAGANHGDSFVIITATFAEENDVNFLEFFEQIIVE